MNYRFLVLVTAAILAGCTQAPEPTRTTAPPSPTTTQTIAASAELPAWRLGQGWTYVVEIPGEPARTFDMMIAEEREDLWVVASNDRTVALHHVLYSTNPVLGRIGKQTLSPFQSGEPVRMFQFPLTDGKTWTADFFGESMSFRAEYAGDISLAGIDASSGLPSRVDGFRITAKGGSGTSVHYDYVEAVGWMSNFEVVKDGLKQIRLSLRDIEKAYRGPYYFYRGAPEDESLIKEFSHTGALTVQSYPAPQSDRFQDGVAVGVVYVGKSGNPQPILNLSLKTQAGAELWSDQFEQARQDDTVVGFAGTSGPWTLDARQTGTFTAEVRVVGYSKFAEGTL